MRRAQRTYFAPFAFFAVLQSANIPRVHASFAYAQRPSFADVACDQPMLCPGACSRTASRAERQSDPCGNTNAHTASGKHQARAGRKVLLEDSAARDELSRLLV